MQGWVCNRCGATGAGVGECGAEQSFDAHECEGMRPLREMRQDLLLRVIHGELSEAEAWAQVDSARPAPKRDMRVDFECWGVRGCCELPKYAVAREEESPIEAVCRAIENKNRGKVVINCRPDCHTADGESHYQLTIGRRCPGGGYTPTAERWVSVRGFRDRR